MGSPQHLGNAVRRQVIRTVMLAGAMTVCWWFIYSGNSVQLLTALPQHQQQSVSTPFEIFNTSQDEIHHESLSRIYELSLEGTNKLSNLVNTLHSRVDRSAEGGDVLEVNTTAPSWRLWDDDDPVDNPCVNYETRFGCGLVRVWLTSFPRSGNTWTRYLLEAATGIFTGSVFNDKTLYRSGFLGEIDRVDSGRTLVQKTHGLGLYSSGLRNLQERYDAASPNQPTILLLRNPARAIVSYWEYICAQDKKHTAVVSDNRIFDNKFFHLYVKKAISSWEELALDRLLWCKQPLYVLHYEHLVQNTTYQLHQLLDFLGVPVDEGRMACVSSHPMGAFKRNNTKVNDPFTQEEKKMMSNTVSRITRLLFALGYPQPPVYEGLS
ncbi:WSC domain-containing protein 1-like isoform X2 [Homarus americanus]|uniref:WSC domain-containing protein 1-like isoform X2 n=1 Tax=Homarus americanus TaxID=6706 RepID=UPI001C45D15A|nr:WSC domain-containing protein 1-like isoform X2 [Homarus americanus]